ncbi:hypothetical protein GCM10025868_27620 [Angustibacter aerolatus]|uniref:Bacterial Ig-like domain-containing protein n=1 Tax=Angustibacter aerolatus TaxID=1162965 RepID=A0ABQ6JKX9_9ACTN|nr:hypothetical protein [Angustibacter aerolatus]GMA87512.1 hypothetical protein GCM10025868_27620 [Angustibacter aerolatus]
MPFTDTFTVSGTVSASGTVADEVEYATLERFEDGAWVIDSSNGVDGRAFTFQVSNYSEGTHTYRVVTDATEHGLAGVSPSFAVTAEPFSPPEP